MIYDIYVIPQNGEGIPVKLDSWDGTEKLVIPINAFNENSVLEIEASA